MIPIPWAIVVGKGGDRMIRQLYAVSMLTLLTVTCVGLKWAQEGVGFLIDRVEPNVDPADGSSEDAAD